ncbi:MAG TPA: hypothetical protein VMN36_13900 [Verrucomicrobiales bacterium]|nr:hypothetical protein [Verrucomicrobiales bacterium]
MNRCLIAILAFAWSAPLAMSEVFLDIDDFGERLGGWEKKRGLAAVYRVSDSSYRTYRPAVTKTPEGGIFVSVRIDNVRGVFAANDHASLEITFDSGGRVVSARSSISLQGKRITSDLIVGGVQVGKAAASITPADALIKVSSDLVANLTEKISKEGAVEPGRVTFPAVVQHNFNILFQAVRLVENGRSISLADVGRSEAKVEVAGAEDSARVDIQLQPPGQPTIQPQPQPPPPPPPQPQPQPQPDAAAQGPGLPGGDG